MSKRIVLYSKFCIKCMWPEELRRFQEYVVRNGYSYEFRRTAYRPKWHKEASEIYGGEDYTVFFTEGGKVVDLLTWEEKTKKKPLRKGKKKNADEKKQSENE